MPRGRKPNQPNQLEEAIMPKNIQVTEEAPKVVSITSADMEKQTPSLTHPDMEKIKKMSRADLESAYLRSQMTLIELQTIVKQLKQK
jgi:hypothetical protein